MNEFEKGVNEGEFTIHSDPNTQRNAPSICMGGAFSGHDGQTFSFIINPRNGELEQDDLIRTLRLLELSQMRQATGWTPDRHSLWEKFRDEFKGRKT